MSTADEQKKLKAFIERRHPLYEALQEHWEFLTATYEGGRDWFASNIFRYIKEGDTEYEERVHRAYRFNHTREVVDLVDKYIFKMEIKRNEQVMPDFLKQFVKKATLSGLDMTDFMKRVSNRASVFGMPYVVVDSTAKQEVVTVADERRVDARAYAYLVSPLQVLDVSYDDAGQMRWILIHEIARDDEDPMESSGVEEDRYRLWTRTYSQLFRTESDGRKKIIVADPEIAHNLGVVPVVRAPNIITDEKYEAPAMIADVAYLDRAVANYLSNLDAIIQDQTFSQLVLPAGNSDVEDKMKEIGTKRIFTFDSEHGKPEYISPDVKQAELILKAINKIINEIYHSIGLAGERTKEDNALGIDNSSGVAKAYDFERVNSLLAAKAAALQIVENKIFELVALWNGKRAIKTPDESPLTQYPDTFDVRGLYDEFEIAARLSLVEAPDILRRDQMRSLAKKLNPQPTQKFIDDLEAELKSWPPKLTVEDPNAQGSGTQVIDQTAKNSLANKLVKA